MLIIISEMYLNSSQQEKHTFFPAVNTSMMRSWHLNQLFNSSIFSNMDMIINITDCAIKYSGILRLKKLRWVKGFRTLPTKQMSRCQSISTSVLVAASVRLLCFMGTRTLAQLIGHILSKAFTFCRYTRNLTNYFFVSKEWKQPTWLAAG